MSSTPIVREHSDVCTQGHCACGLESSPNQMTDNEQRIERLHQLALGAARDLAHARRKLGEAQAKYQVAADEYNRAVLDSWGWVHAS